MLPQKISELVQELRAKTESGKLSWIYDDERASVSSSVSQLNIDVSISYRFDTIEEVGTFRVDIHDKSRNSELVFTTTQMYNDFEVVRALYDSAQASGFDFTF
ncbi:MAG: hypothetical protein RPR97_02410 [Colwellia sp.]|jgi:hypothetical protein